MEQLANILSLTKDEASVIIMVLLCAIPALATAAGLFAGSRID